MDHTKATYEGRELDIWIGSYKVRAFPWPASNDIYECPVFRARAVYRRGSGV